MSTIGHSGRLDRLETLWHEPNVCPRCHDRPRRYATVDAAGTVLHENLPASGCPHCGAALLIDREYTLDDDPDGPKVTG